jgi:SAM-dependent methyltransferase
MDVGCGDGFMLEMARALGWRAVGLEVDSAAVQASRSRGLEVVEGSVSCLGEYLGEFDCIICSHVLEHVHEPSTLLLNLHKALKVGGVLLLSSPNAGSQVRRHFGNDWRGLEAPRHLSIPSLQQLEIMLVGLGFSVRQVLERPVATGIESARIRRRGLHISPQDTATARSMAAGLTTASREQYDFLELVCVKNDRPEPSLK